MTEERITERTDPTGNVVERTVERSDPVMVATPVASSGGGMTGIFLVLLLGVLAVGGYFLFANQGESKKDAAITDAAENVGKAAKKLGESAERAVDNIDKK